MRHPRDQLARKEYSGVVYKIKCKEHNGEYIGKTVWQLTEYKNVRT